MDGSGNDGDHKDNKEDENQEQSFNLPSIAQLAHNHPHPLIIIIVFIRRQPHHHRYDGNLLSITQLAE